MADRTSRPDRVLTKAEQDKLSPHDVLEVLRAGNERFVNATRTERDHSALVRDAVAGQWPKAVVLSCLDSRIPVEDVFDLSIGDLFVARVAGNIVNVDILGSMEFACALSGAKLVLVLGHDGCGAIRGAIDKAEIGKAEIGNLTALLHTIAPAADEIGYFAGERSSENPAFMQRVAEQNVHRMVRRIRTESPVLRDLEARGRIAIAGGMYDMHTGQVRFYD
jgi:carbonic anhydrase